MGLLWTCEQLTLHMPCSILRWIQHQMIPKGITRPASKPLAILCCAGAASRGRRWCSCEMKAGTSLAALRLRPG